MAAADPRMQLPLPHACMPERPLHVATYELPDWPSRCLPQEFQGSVGDPLYGHATTYLNARGNRDVHRLTASLPRGSGTRVQFALAREAQTSDTYRWAPACTPAWQAVPVKHRAAPVGHRCRLARDAEALGSAPAVHGCQAAVRCQAGPGTAASGAPACSGAVFWWTHIIDARAGGVYVSTQGTPQDDVRSLQLKVGAALHPRFCGACWRGLQRTERTVLL